MRRSLLAALLVSLAAASLAACGSSDTPTATVETETITVEATPSPATPTTPAVDVARSQILDQPSAPIPAPPAAAPVATLMPAVVCMNLQDAQNLIQEAGVFYSRSVDAIGRDRNQVLDSNWSVVGQTPDPGTPIGEGDAVLSVVKLGEAGDCS